MSYETINGIDVTPGVHHMVLTTTYISRTLFVDTMNHNRIDYEILYRKDGTGKPFQMNGLNVPKHGSYIKYKVF